MGCIEMLEVLLVESKGPVEPTSGYITEHFNPERDFNRCYFLFRKGVDLRCLGGFDIGDFLEKKNRFTKLIMETVVERGCTILGTPTPQDVGIFDIIIHSLFDLNCSFYYDPSPRVI